MQSCEHILLLCGGTCTHTHTHQTLCTGYTVAILHTTHDARALAGRPEYSKAGVQDCRDAWMHACTHLPMCAYSYLLARLLLYLAPYHTQNCRFKGPTLFYTSISDGGVPSMLHPFPEVAEHAATPRRAISAVPTMLSTRAPT